jgi:hypothetical protein
MASPAIDRQGNIGIGYSFGGTPHFPGQRFAGRCADDPPGQLTFQETVLADGVPCEWLIPRGSRKHVVLLYLHGGAELFLLSAFSSPFSAHKVSSTVLL